MGKLKLTELDRISSKYKIDMVQRVTFRRNHCFATKSNKFNKVKTPGGRLIIQYRTKKSTPLKCHLTGQRLSGISALRPAMRRRAASKHKTVHRPYGGVLSQKAVRER